MPECVPTSLILLLYNHACVQPLFFSQSASEKLHFKTNFTKFATICRNHMCVKWQLVLYTVLILKLVDLILSVLLNSRELKLSVHSEYISMDIGQGIGLGMRFPTLRIFDVVQCTRH